MNAPFFKFGAFGDEFSLVIAFVIGIGFGFALERAGFGSARKLVAQFYLTDLAVFKVMFTGIVTAMLGIYYLSWAGFVDITLVYSPNTYILPQVVGGLLLGFGFVIGGYCPGTSVVAVSTGRMDGLAYAGGIVFGTFAFGEAFPLVKDFYYATDMGFMTLPGWLGIPYGAVVLVVVLIALGGFYGAGFVERHFAPKTTEG